MQTKYKVFGLVDDCVGGRGGTGLYHGEHITFDFQPNAKTLKDSDLVRHTAANHASVFEPDNPG